MFTSAGDRSHFPTQWVGPGQEFDLFVVYYGDDDERYERYRESSSWITRRKGSKYQNFLYFYQSFPDVVARYRRFLILDDDLEFDGGAAAINRLFALAKRHRLSICGPSFTPDGKVSWDVNAHRPGISMAHTNFVEVNAQLFSRPALDRLMQWVTPELIGWGIDYLATWANGMEQERSYAVIHEVKCRNPHDHDRDDRRELDQVPGADRRQATWESYAKTIGCPPEFELVEYEAVPMKPASRASVS